MGRHCGGWVESRVSRPSQVVCICHSRHPGDLACPKGHPKGSVQFYYIPETPRISCTKPIWDGPGSLVNIAALHVLMRRSDPASKPKPGYRSGWSREVGCPCITRRPRPRNRTYSILFVASHESQKVPAVPTQAMCRRPIRLSVCRHADVRLLH